ncbi:Ig domain-containing protein, partial [Corynebacterium striatum]
QNAEYNATVAVKGGKSPYTYAVSTGTLPEGLSLNESIGAITGTPTAAGKSTFTVKVTDEGKLSATKQLTINVAAA